MNRYVWMPLTQDNATLIDANTQHLFDGVKWCCQFRGRKKHLQPVATRTVYSRDGRRANLLLHRIIVNAPEGLVVDHINGDSLDNRRENLRICTQKQNAMNCHKPNKWKGVVFRRARGSIRLHWQAYIMLNRKFVSLGCYQNPLDAAIAYNKAAGKYFGEFACLNDLSLLPPYVTA